MRPTTAARGRYHARVSEQLGRLGPPASKSRSDWPGRSREGGASGGRTPWWPGLRSLPSASPALHRPGGPGPGPAPGAESQDPPPRRRIQGPPTGGRSAPAPGSDGRLKQPEPRSQAGSSRARNSFAFPPLPPVASRPQPAVSQSSQLSWCVFPAWRSERLDPARSIAGPGAGPNIGYLCTAQSVFI